MTEPLGEGPALELVDLVKEFRGRRVVHGLSLVVPRGSLYGLVGPNGAGKTTTLSMATGLLRPDGGTARILGHDVWADPAAAKAVMGISPDGMRLFEQLSGRELLTYVGALRRMPREVTAERATELLTVLDLADDASTVVADYSAGMVKKISLAAALIHAPRLLVLDEPFEAVDPVSGQTIRTILRRYVAERRHGRHVEPRHGARRGAVRPGRRHRRRAGARRGQHRGADPGRVPPPAVPRAGRRVRRRRRGADVVGLIVRLRFAMWRTAMTRSPLHLVSSIVGGLAALGVLALLGPGLLLLSQRPLRITALTVPLFTVITLMWTVLSLIATGVDSILDPARFSVLPLRAGELARGLLAAACTGIPAVMLIGLALAQAGSWLAHPAAVPAALLGGGARGADRDPALPRGHQRAGPGDDHAGRAGPGGRRRVGRHAHPARDERAADDRARSAPT